MSSWQHFYLEVSGTCRRSRDVALSYARVARDLKDSGHVRYFIGQARRWNHMCIEAARKSQERASTLVVVLALVMFAITGCASMSTETRVEESVWQVMNAADAYSTNYGINNSPDFVESNAWTIFGGDRPSTERIAEAAVAWGALHFSVTSILANHDAPKWLQRTWQFLMITNTGFVINNNRKVIRIEDERKNQQPINCTRGACK